MAASSVNMFFISFITTGIVIQLIYFNWLGDIDFLPALLLAEYDEFTQEWYSTLGTTICVTLILLVLTTPASNLGF